MTQDGRIDNDGGVSGDLDQLILGQAASARIGTVMIGQSMSHSGIQAHVLR
jgi:hypothetical protein